MIELDEARDETVGDISQCLSRLSRARYLLSPAERVFIAEELRNVADEFDGGAGDRLRHRLRFGRYRLVTLEGPNGRPLYRLE
jgi:hypothetical protein